MKNVIKIVFLYILVIVVGIAVLKITNFAKELPIDLHDGVDLVISDTYNYPANAMSFEENGWVIKDVDPYIYISNINKYIHGFEIALDNKKDNIEFALYYNIGYGFNQKQVTGVAGKGNGVYYTELTGNVYEIRIDVENALPETVISNMTVTLFSGHDFFKKAVIRFLIYNVIFAIICSVQIFVEILVKKSSMKMAALKVLVYIIVIGLTERAFFKMPISTSTLMLLIDVAVVVACMFFDINNPEDKTLSDYIEEEKNYEEN